ncbi:MAG: prenyltransferase/squalene oxidase repeat-containing protein [Isosphaeraceae bacterium]
MGLFLLALALAWPPGQSSSVVQAQPPLSASAADSPSQPKPVLPLPESELSAAIERGAGYLCRTQNPDGSWGSPRWTGGVDRDPVPGAFLSFGTATTALCLEALLAVPDSPQIQNARARAEAFLLENLPRLRRADPFNLPNIWGHAYGIQVLAVLARREPAGSARRSRLEQCMREQIKALEHFETVCGGWFYYADGLQRPLAPSASFVNAAVLVALDRAKPLGITMDERILTRAIRSTADQRKPDSSYLYSLSSPLDKAAAKSPINRPAGSLGRSQACNLALRLWGDKRITDAVITEWLDRLITRNGWLDMGRKRPIPHESFAQVAGYFFYFGHYHAALCIGQLPEADRPRYQDQLGRILVRIQESDGSWFDYPLYSYHKPYGTAFALLALECCRKPDSGLDPAESSSGKLPVGKGGSGREKP